MMKRLDIYISKNFIKSFFISLLAFVNIFILSQLFRVIKYILDGKMTSFDGGKYIVYLLPRILIEVSPLAILLGGLMCINKMASNLEIISLKTSGISFRRIVRYPILISLIVSLIVFQLMDKVYPKTLARSRSLRSGKKERVQIRANSKENAFLRTEKNIVYYFKKIDRINNTGELLEIVKLNGSFSDVEWLLTAKSGIFDKEKNIWRFYDVVKNDLKIGKEENYKVYEDKALNDAPDNFIILQVRPDELTNKEIKREIRDISVTGGDTKEALATLGKRYSFPFASFIVSFLGLSLGSRYVRGSSAISIALSVVLGYAYYIVQASFEAMSVNGVLNPFLGGWIPNIIFLGLGLYFMRKAEY